MNGAGIPGIQDVLYIHLCTYNIVYNFVNTNMISGINGLIILPSLNK